MERRLELQAKLEQILGSDKVYYQPPASVRLSYPCIIYELSKKKSWYANNKNYNYQNRYSVMVIDRDPDSTIPHDILMNFNLCDHDREYKADNLYHSVFTIYY